MFYSNTSIYLYYPNTSSPDATYVYNVSTGVFTQNDLQDGFDGTPDGFMTQYAESYGWQDVSIPAIGIAYYAGTASSGTPVKVRRNEVQADPQLSKRDQGTEPWMQSLNLAPGNLAWTKAQGSPPLLDYATLQYVRAGSNGILVALGGTDPASHTQFTESSLNDYRDMSEILVYDIASSTWFNVTAMGDIPTARIEFCSGVSAAPDSSSFQITIYGGYNLFDGTALNDIYALTIPAFEWINVTPTNQSGGDGAKYGRHYHHCEVWQDSQMLVLGGVVELLNSGDTVNGCDTTHPPLLLLNTITYEWMDTFEPQMRYTQPSQIYNAIGGDISGNAPSQPSGGFKDSALASVFAQRVSYTPMPALQPPATSLASSAPSTSAGTQPSSSSSSPSSLSSPSLDSGAIAGIVVGGAVGLALIVGAVYFFLRRRHRPGDSRESSELDFKHTELTGRPMHDSGGTPTVEVDGTNPKERIEVPGDSSHDMAIMQTRLYELSE
ncbi:MAG: hypothetical protein M1822_006624 [Bathelium mastoideum]|nr:MAG: hypothetical protein M1822_006624 [Bathelium mastoideum]